MFAIENLSRTEKLRMMEALWRDLSADAGALDSPAWHGDALREAEAALTNGTAGWLDWSQAKDALRNRARA